MLKERADAFSFITYWGKHVLKKIEGSEMRENYQRRSRLFGNSNISLIISDDELEELRTQNNLNTDKTLRKVLQILDDEFDAVPVAETTQITVDSISSYPIFSYQTLKEYIITTEDLEMLMRGKCIRLRARESSNETFSTMIWH